MNILVRDVGVEAGIVGNVFHFLNSTVWQENGVLADGVVFNLLLRMGEVVSAFVVRDVISEGVW